MLKDRLKPQKEIIFKNENIEKNKSVSSFHSEKKV
jgi:hypothetical protein